MHNQNRKNQQGPPPPNPYNIPLPNATGGMPPFVPPMPMHFPPFPGQPGMPPMGFPNLPFPPPPMPGFPVPLSNQPLPPPMFPGMPMPLDPKGLPFPMPMLPPGLPLPMGLPPQPMAPLPKMPVPPPPLPPTPQASSSTTPATENSVKPANIGKLSATDLREREKRREQCLSQLHKNLLPSVIPDSINLDFSVPLKETDRPIVTPVGELKRMIYEENTNTLQSYAISITGLPLSMEHFFVEAESKTRLTSAYANPSSSEFAFSSSAIPPLNYLKTSEEMERSTAWNFVFLSFLKSICPRLEWMRAVDPETQQPLPFGIIRTRSIVRGDRLARLLRWFFMSTDYERIVVNQPDPIEAAKESSIEPPKESPDSLHSSLSLGDSEAKEEGEEGEVPAELLVKASEPEAPVVAALDDKEKAKESRSEKISPYRYLSIFDESIVHPIFSSEGHNFSESELVTLKENKPVWTLLQQLCLLLDRDHFVSVSKENSESKEDSFSPKLPVDVIVDASMHASVAESLFSISGSLVYNVKKAIAEKDSSSDSVGDSDGTKGEIKSEAVVVESSSDSATDTPAVPATESSGEEEETVEVDHLVALARILSTVLPITSQSDLEINSHLSELGEAYLPLCYIVLRELEGLCIFQRGLDQLFSIESKENADSEFDSLLAKTNPENSLNNKKSVSGGRLQKMASFVCENASIAIERLSAYLCVPNTPAPISSFTATLHSNITMGPTVVELYPLLEGHPTPESARALLPSVAAFRKRLLDREGALVAADNDRTLRDINRLRAAARDPEKWHSANIPPVPAVSSQTAQSKQPRTSASGGISTTTTTASSAAAKTTADIESETASLLSAAIMASTTPSTPGSVQSSLSTSQEEARKSASLAVLASIFDPTKKKEKEKTSFQKGVAALLEKHMGIEDEEIVQMFLHSVSSTLENEAASETGSKSSADEAIKFDRLLALLGQEYAETFEAPQNAMEDIKQFFFSLI